jgi:DNA replication and repair protein RecF
MAEAVPMVQTRADIKTSNALRAPHLTRLRLRHFRSHGALDIACQAGTVLLTGENGIGKTNVLEAISMLASGRGLRSGQLDEMTQSGQQAWHVLADMDGPTGAMRVSVDYQQQAAGRRIRIDGETARGFDYLSEALPQLWLTPSMDRLFNDGASGRRKFLDRFAQTLDAGLSRHLSQFERAMRERNKLLQAGNSQQANNSWLDGLEDTMALQGVAIAASRLSALDTLAQGLAQMPDNAFPRAQVALEGALEAALRDRSALEVEDDYRSQLRQARGLDAAAGRTLEGPHRSDLKVSHSAKAMPASACSTGEQKALLVGLILAQARSVAARLGDVPVLLLDEVAAHLDAHRRAALADILSDLGGQSWITGTDIDMFTAFGDAVTHVDFTGLVATPFETPPV